MGHCIACSQQLLLGKMEADHACSAVGEMAPKPNLSSRTIDVDVEAEMQDVMAEALEDARLDDGAIEIGSDDEYQ